jgi:OFA family oxalate/formate antiporter-like MFS transporter
MRVVLALLALVLVCQTALASLSVDRGTTLHGSRTEKKGAAVAVVGAAVKTSSKKTTGAATVAAPLELGGLGCIVGGALAHLVLGTLYCWGNFLSYSPLSLRFFDGQEHPGAAPDSLYVIPLTLVAQAAAMPFGPGLVSKYGASRTLLLGSLITAFSVYAASYQERLGLFVAFYSLLFGTGVGLAYTAPMIAGWKWLPNAKGLVSGGILTGFGAGGFIFSLIGTKIVNPKGLNPIKGKFPPEVYANFPKMLRTLSLIYAATATVGSLLITEHKAVPTSKGKAAAVAPELPGLTLGEALKTQQFWMMWAMIISSGSAGLTVSSIYKQFASGAPALSGDAYQATVGGLGALSNGFGRLLWGLIADKIGFKKSFTILTLLQMTLMATYSSSIWSKQVFAAHTCMLFFCLAGNLALMPSAAQRMFGPRAGATTYGVMFSAFGIASVFGSSLTKALSASYGWAGTFNVLAVLSVLATVIVSQLTPIQALPSSAV